MPSKDFSGKGKIFFFAGFILLNLFLSYYFVDLWLTPNTTSRALPVLTLHEDKSLVIDKYQQYTGDISKVGDHYYSDKAPLATFIVYPFYSLYKKLNLPEIPDTVFKKHPIYIWENIGMADGRVFLLPKTGIVFMIGDFLCGTLPFVLVLFITLYTIRKKTTGASPVLLTMLAFYGTYLFVYTGTFTGHLLAGFFLFLGYYFMKEKKWFLPAGIAMGLGFATEYTLAIIFPAWLLQVWYREKSFKNAFLMGLGILPGALLVLYHNHLVTGSPFTTPYSFVANKEYQGVAGLGFGAPSLSAFWGLTFSRFRGLLIYAPVLALFLFYVLWHNREHVSRFFNYEKKTYLQAWLSNYLIAGMAFFLLFISSHLLWWGGWAFGPRHLIPITFIALYEGVVYLSGKKFSLPVFVLGSSAGLLFAWLAKCTKVFMMPYNEIAKQFLNPISEVVMADFSKNKFNGGNILTILFDTNLKTALFLWPVLFFAGMLALMYWYRQVYPLPQVRPAQKHAEKTAPSKKTFKKK